MTEQQVLMLVMVGKLQQEKRNNCALNAIRGSGTMVGLLHIHACNRSLCKLSVQFSHSVVSNSLRPHGLQHGEIPNIFPTALHIFTL